MGVAAPRLRTVTDDERFHSAMAGLLMERGFHGLARSHQIAAGLFLSQETRSAEVARSWVAHREARGTTDAGATG